MPFHLTVGPMFVGKSEDQISKAFHLRSLGQVKNTVVFIPKIDTRSNNDITTHNGKSIRSLGFDVMSISKPSEMLEYMKHPIMFAIIDEMQFFDGTIVDVVKGCKDRMEIFGSGLDRTSEDKDFGPMKELIEIADYLKVLSGKCKCGNMSTMTKSLAPKTGDVLVGGSEKYVTVCRRCWEK